MIRARLMTAMAVLLPFGAARAQADWVAERATLPRGTTYEIRKPNSWNGTLISDLDFAGRPDDPAYAWLLQHGYALSGTARRADRGTNYDPAREIVDLINVMDVFASRFGKPRRTIQFGGSGAGFIVLAMAELHPDRIDGAVAACAHVPVWVNSAVLDARFVLKTLVAPELRITDAPSDTAGQAAAWTAALTAAQQTPIGRARIALALTIGQRPAWASTTTPEPDPNDVPALQRSMFETMLELASRIPAERMLEAAAPGRLSWNTGIDYEASFRAGEAANQSATRRLYTLAGVTLESDLRRLKSATRIKADPLAIRWWSSPGRTVLGEPKVPLLRIHTSGDGVVPPAVVQGYDAAVKARGYADLYRTAFVHAPGHCAFTLAEVAASIEIVMQRLNTGKWGSTRPDALNALGRTLDPSSASRFFAYIQVKYNRAWFPTPSESLGRGVQRPQDSRPPTPR